MKYQKLPFVLLFLSTLPCQDSDGVVCPVLGAAKVKHLNVLIFTAETCDFFSK